MASFPLQLGRAAEIWIEHLRPVSSHPSVLSTNANSLILPLNLLHGWHSVQVKTALSSSSFYPKNVGFWDLHFLGVIRYAASHVGYPFVVMWKTVNISFES